MIERLVEFVLSAQAAYRNLDADDLADVRRSVEENLREILESLAHRRPASKAAPLETARRRAEMGVPLGAVLHAYRLGYRVVWEALIDRAKREGR